MWIDEQIPIAAEQALRRTISIDPALSGWRTQLCPDHQSVAIDERPAACPVCVEDLRNALRYHIALNQQLHLVCDATAAVCRALIGL